MFLPLYSQDIFKLENPDKYIIKINPSLHTSHVYSNLSPEMNRFSGYLKLLEKTNFHFFNNPKAIMECMDKKLMKNKSLKGVPNKIMDPTDKISFNMNDVEYETICIGGVNFFNKRIDLGRVLPSMFSKSYWTPKFSTTVKDSFEHQLDFIKKKLDEYENNQRIFMYVNMTATHYPTFFI